MISLLLMTLLLPNTSTPFSFAKPAIKLQVDQEANSILREWIAGIGEHYSAVKIESPNLEFAFRINGKITGRWHGATSLSESYDETAYQTTIYDINATIIYGREKNDQKETIVTAKSKIKINTRKGLGVHIDVPMAKLVAEKPINGVYFFDSEWFKKTESWELPLPKRDTDSHAIIWRSKLDNLVDRKIVDVNSPPTIELVARPVR